VHLNPVRAKLLQPDEALRRYRWSSFPGYLQKPSQRPDWLRVGRVLGECGIPKDSAAGRRTFERLVEARGNQRPGTGEYAGIRRGWCFGGEAFRQELLEQVSTKAGSQHYGDELRESEAAKAERLVTLEMRQRGWMESDLVARRKGDPGKVAIAQFLRRETTVTLSWIVQRLRMGTKTNLAHLLYWERRREREKK
jgi:hypothetical protein